MDVTLSVSVIFTIFTIGVLVGGAFGIASIWVTWWAFKKFGILMDEQVERELVLEPQAQRKTPRIVTRRGPANPSLRRIDGGEGE